MSVNETYAMAVNIKRLIARAGQKRIDVDGILSAFCISRNLIDWKGADDDSLTELSNELLEALK